MKNPIILYTDGSCLGNPGPGGWAAILQHEGKEVVLSGHESETTNNRMEMTAVIRGFQWVKDNALQDQKVKLFSDSSLLVNTATKGWKRKQNLDLWNEFDAAYNGLKVEFNWVKGHAGNEMNERCDRIAVAEAEKAERSSRKRVPNQDSSSDSASGDESFQCPHCRKASEGRLGYLSESGLIRVDCPHCGRYIKFAAPTPSNLARAKKRPLLTKAQIEAFKSKFQEKGEPLTERQIKQLKAMTRDEAHLHFEAQQGMF